MEGKKIYREGNLTKVDPDHPDRLASPFSYLAGREMNQEPLSSLPESENEKEEKDSQ